MDAQPISTAHCAMADDIAALIRHLGYDQVDVMGYSLGSGAAPRVASQHLALVWDPVLVAVTYQRSGSYPEVLGAMDQMRGAAMPAGMARINPLSSWRCCRDRRTMTFLPRGCSSRLLRPFSRHCCPAECEDIQKEIR